MGVRGVEVKEEVLRRRVEGWRDGSKGILLHASPAAGKSFAVRASLPRAGLRATIPEI